MIDPYLIRKEKIIRNKVLSPAGGIVSITIPHPVGDVLTIERVWADWLSVTTENGGYFQLGLLQQDIIPPAGTNLHLQRGLKWIKTVPVIGGSIGGIWLTDGSLLAVPDHGPNYHENEELNITLEGGTDVHVTFMGYSENATSISFGVVYRTEKRDARGKSHG